MNSVALAARYKIRSIQTPAIDKLDPSINFNKQLRRAINKIDDDATNFKNCQESLIQAKKDKLSTVRDAQK